MIFYKKYFVGSISELVSIFFENMIEKEKRITSIIKIWRQYETTEKSSGN